MVPRMRRQRQWSIVVVSLMASGCGLGTLRTNPDAGPGPIRSEAIFDHGAFDALLRRHVDGEGLVDYAGLAADRSLLVVYLNRLAVVDPNLLGTPEEQRAFWINAWNASVLFGLLHWRPQDGMDELAGFTTAVTTRCGGHWWTLAEMRDRVLRTSGDARVLLALCDGRRAGPRLRAEAYTGARLDELLTAQCREFVADGRKVRIDDGARRAAVGPPLSTFANDFTVAPWYGLSGFLARHALPREWMRQPFPVDALPVDAMLNRR